MKSHIKKLWESPSQFNDIIFNTKKPLIINDRNFENVKHFRGEFLLKSYVLEIEVLISNT